MANVKTIEICLERNGSEFCARVIGAPDELERYVGCAAVGSKRRAALTALCNSIRSKGMVAPMTMQVALDRTNPVCLLERVEQWDGGQVRGFGQWASDVGSDGAHRYQVVTRSDGGWEIHWLVPVRRPVLSHGQLLCEILQYRRRKVVEGRGRVDGSLDLDWQALVRIGLTQLRPVPGLPRYGSTVARGKSEIGIVVGSRLGCRILLILLPDGTSRVELFTYRLEHSLAARQSIRLGAIARRKAEGQRLAPGRIMFDSMRGSGDIQATEFAQGIFWGPFQSKLTDPFIFRAFNPCRRDLLPIPLARAAMALITISLHSRQLLDTGVCLSLKGAGRHSGWRVSARRDEDRRRLSDGGLRRVIGRLFRVWHDAGGQLPPRSEWRSSDGPRKVFPMLQFRVEPVTAHRVIGLLRTLPSLLMAVGIAEAQIPDLISAARATTWDA